MTYTAKAWSVPKLPQVPDEPIWAAPSPLMPYGHRRIGENLPMTQNEPRRVAEIHSYHAHIYYDPVTTRPVAERLRQQIAERFAVQFGRWHDANVGPHVRAMYQVAFATETFALLVPWLMLNRAGLTVLIHPNTDNPQDDHLEKALWLGEKLDVRGDVLPDTLNDHGHDAIVPNTTPTQSP